MDAHWARHWDTISLGTVTIATAVLGAVILLAGGSDVVVALADGKSSAQQTIRAAFAAAAAVAYMVLSIAAGISIYVFSGNSSAHTSIKRWTGFAVYLLFAVEVFALAALPAVNLVTGAAGASGQPETTANHAIAPVSSGFAFTPAAAIIQ